MRRRGAAIATLALFAVAASLGACGEKDEPRPGPAAPEPAPPPAFGEAADAACSEAMAEQERIRRLEGGRQKTLADRARLLVELAPARARLAEDLAALEPAAGSAPEARRLVAAAQRRAEASAEAGRLHEDGGPRAAIAAAAAAEHDERELFVEIAGELGLTDCAEVLAPTERRRVRAAVERALGPGEAIERCAAFGERLLAEMYGGGRRACVEAGASGFRTGSVELGAAPEGIDRVFALATARVEERGGGSETYRVRLTYEDGDYKVDKLD